MPCCCALASPHHSPSSKPSFFHAPSLLLSFSLIMLLHVYTHINIQMQPLSPFSVTHIRYYLDILFFSRLAAGIFALFSRKFQNQSLCISSVTVSQASLYCTIDRKHVVELSILQSLSLSLNEYGIYYF